jgi:hypothetical protein
MSDPTKPPKKAKKTKEQIQIEELDLNKETLADLTEGEAQHVKGGLRRGVSVGGCTSTCATACTNCLQC